MKNFFKKYLLNKKTLILIIILLVILVGVFYVKYVNLKYELLWEKSVPDVELINYLSFNQNIISGALTGFVLFDNKEKQPKDLKQYIEIKALEYHDKNGKQLFQERDIVKMNLIPPRYFEPVILTIKDSSGSTITLADSDNNLFFIDKITKEVRMSDVTGDTTRLITDEFDYEKFMREFLK